jgi:predicted RNase H-like nuclease (RuvC/YqgF family)
MIDSFEMQKRYFTSQLKQFRTKPELNRARIKDCEYYLEMLEEAGTPAEFKKRIQQTGNMVSTAKAESYDRYDNRAFIYEELGQERKAEEDRLRLEIIESAGTHSELSQKLEEFEQNTKLSFNENKAINALGSIINALFHLNTDGAGSKDEERSLIRFQTYWKLMNEADPDVSWEKIMTYKPYRDRIIFTDEQMAVLEIKFMEVCDGRHS